MNKITRFSEGIQQFTTEFLLLISKGPFAKQAPADWARVQKECPAIVRKVDDRRIMPTNIYPSEATRYSPIIPSYRYMNMFKHNFNPFVRTFGDRHYIS